MNIVGLNIPEVKLKETDTLPRKSSVPESTIFPEVSIIVPKMCYFFPLTLELNG